MRLKTKIDWKARLKNPIFWAQIAMAIGTPILVGLGLNWSDMTSWAIFWQTFLDAIKNPVIVGAIIVSVWTAITNPTTKGLGDGEPINKEKNFH